MLTFEAARLERASAAILQAAGATAQKAQQVAELLIDAQLVGHDSHGIIRVPQYLQSIERGDVDINARVEILSQTPALAVLDAARDFGQVAMLQAVEIVQAKANAVGLAAVTVRRANHIGRLGVYVERLAQDGLVALLFANASGIPAYRMAPWGGTEARLGTDPLAIGIPTASMPVVVDMTTTVVAEGKVRVKHNSGEQTPDGWLLDAGGSATNDPGVLYREPRGTILPLGGATAGHKGYALNIAIELLGGALSGSGCVGTPQGMTNGVLLIALDAAQLLPPAEYHAESERFFGFVRSSPARVEGQPVLLPGEIEQRSRAHRLKNGIPVYAETWRQFSACASKLSVSTD